MRNAALILAAVVVLGLGFVLARDTSEEQDDAPTAAQTTTSRTIVERVIAEGAELRKTDVAPSRTFSRLVPMRVDGRLGAGLEARGVETAELRAQP